MRIAFVTAALSSVFMAEILEAVAGAVEAVGVPTVSHTGTIAEVDDGATVFVVVPHEYFALSPTPNARTLDRTIAFGVEHPGTRSFEMSSATAARAAGRFELSRESVAEMRARGLSAERFVLGYTPRWDKWGGEPSSRPVDVTFMGTIDEPRAQVLAKISTDLSDLRSELLLAAPQPITAATPDSLVGDAKWEFMARTKLMLNLHRESKTSLEVVRALEAMINGCVLVSEYSTDLGELMPGEHFLMTSRERIGAVARAAIAEPERLAEIGANAYRFCREELDMRGSALRLVEVATSLLRSPPDAGRRAAHGPAAVGTLVAPQTRPGWMPTAHALPSVRIDAASAPAGADGPAPNLPRIDVLHQSPRRPGACVDVLCTQHPGTGPLELTTGSLATQTVTVNLHLATTRADPMPARPRLSTFVDSEATVSLGAVRNCLIGCSDAPYLLILDAGDMVLGDALAPMMAALDSDPEVAISYPIAAYGDESLMNAFAPVGWQLDVSAYLSRGYLIRRSWLLERIGLFSTDPTRNTFVDHDIWVKTVGHGGRAAHQRTIGMRLWPGNPG